MPTACSAMNTILEFPLRDDQAALWTLGQAGCVLRGCGKTLVIDPYLSDSAAGRDGKYRRLIPVPIEPADLAVDIFIVTHDHLDHLDPDTIRAYPRKDGTVFVAPRLACHALRTLGILERNIRRLDSGEELDLDGILLQGTYAVPTEPCVVDTCGYAVRFSNGRTLCHVSDTAWSELLLQTTPKTEVILVPINGKWGNLNIRQAADLAAHVAPTTAIPMHYDMMALNSADPADFAQSLKERNPAVAVQILKVLQPFVW